MVYDAVMQKIVDEIAPILADGNYDEGIETGIERIIEAVDRDFSLVEWYRAPLLLAAFSLTSLIVAVVNARRTNPGWGWLLLGSVGYLILWVCGLIAALFNKIDGRGMGSASLAGVDGSDGGGSDGGA